MNETTDYHFNFILLNLQKLLYQNKIFVQNKKIPISKLRVPFKLCSDLKFLRYLCSVCTHRIPIERQCFQSDPILSICVRILFYIVSGHYLKCCIFILATIILILVLKLKFFIGSSPNRWIAKYFSEPKGRSHLGSSQKIGRARKLVSLPKSIWSESSVLVIVRLGLCNAGELYLVCNCIFEGRLKTQRNSYYHKVLFYLSPIE